MLRTFKYIAFFGVASLILLYSGKISSYQGSDIPPDTSASVVKLIFIGDIMQHDGQIASAWDDSLKAYTYDSCFKYVAPIIQSADLPWPIWK